MRADRGSIGRGARLAATGLLLLLSGPALSRAQCAGDMTTLTGYYVAMASSTSPAPGPLYLFLSPGCTYSKFGPAPPTMCLVGKSMPGPNTYAAYVRANWTTGAFNLTINGCVFNCGTDSCTLRGETGLPVELMEFSVEGDDETGMDSESPGER